MSWNANLGKQLVKQAKESAGGEEAWSRLLTTPIKEALIAEQVLGVVTTQDGETVRVADVEALLLDARVAAGLCPLLTPRTAAKATRRFIKTMGGSKRPPVDPGDCPSCEGKGHIDSRGRGTIDKRERQCGDCRGSGKA